MLVLQPKFKPKYLLPTRQIHDGYYGGRTTQKPIQSPLHPTPYDDVQNPPTCFVRDRRSQWPRLKTDCDVVAMRLLAIAVLKPMLTSGLSATFLLITPYVRPFWTESDGAIVSLVRG